MNMTLGETVGGYNLIPKGYWAKPKVDWTWLPFYNVTAAVMLLVVH